MTFNSINKYHFLIIRTDALGDTILTLPVVQLIKQCFPDSKISFLVGARAQELVKYQWGIDDNYVMNGIFGLFRKFPKGVTHSIFFGGSQWVNLVSLFKGVKFRGGLRNKLASFFLLNWGERQARSQVTRHELEYNLDLVKGVILKILEKNDFDLDLGLKKKIKSIIFDPFRINDFRPCLNIDNQLIEDSKKFLLDQCGKQNIQIDTKFEYAVIHPAMSSHTLNWPVANYANLINDKKKIFKDLVWVVTSTKVDLEQIEKLKSHLTAPRTNVVFFDGGPVGLKGLMGLLKGAKFFVGPSTGPIHLAWALNVKIFGFYSPIKAQSPARWAPYQTNGGHIFWPTGYDKDVICEERVRCAGEKCPHYFCMEKMKVEDVIQLIASR
jgi:heptosyltransferase-3